MAHGDAREGKWRGNWRMEWVAGTLHTTSEHGVSSVTTADAQTSAASSRLNWRPRQFKWTRPFRRKTKSGFCACAKNISNAVYHQERAAQIHMSKLSHIHVHEEQMQSGILALFVTVWFYRFISMRHFIWIRNLVWKLRHYCFSLQKISDAWCHVFTESFQ